MDGAGHQFLTGSGFAEQQHGGIAGRHSSDILQNDLQALALPDDFPESEFRIDFLLEIKLLFRQLSPGFA